MNTKETLNKVRTLLGIEVKLEQMKLDNGAILEAEVFEVGAEIFVVADTELVALPIGEYISEDGSTIVVLEEGVIGEIKEAGEEAPAEEEAPVEEEVVESISKETFFSEIEKLRNEINELKLSKEVEEVSVELSVDEVEGISHNPENETSKKELNLYSQKGKNNTINRIFNKLNK